MELSIRAYEPRDAAGLRTCIVELQDFERGIDPRLRTGESMADAYAEQMRARCLMSGGQVFVAEVDAAIAGFVAVLAHEPYVELDDPPGFFALVSDLVVLPGHRGKGIGRRLLAHAEAFVRQAGASELRIGVLARNTVARELYRAVGFEPHVELFSKRLRDL